MLKFVIFVFGLFFFIEKMMCQIKDVRFLNAKVKKTPKSLLSQDTIQIDTVVIIYKRKDTALVMKKYRGKVPIIKSSLGGFGDGEKTTPETMVVLLDSPLVVKDSKGTKYKVLSYRFCYKKKDVFVDDLTMELKTRFDYVSFYVLENPLPLKYRKIIQQELKEGEQFWFEHIVVENDKGEKFLSKDMTMITY